MALIDVIRGNLTRSIALYDDLAAGLPEPSLQNQLLLDLLEHEASHHGQLIRYLYALRLSVPDSWKSRYALT